MRKFTFLGVLCTAFLFVPAARSASRQTIVSSQGVTAQKSPAHMPAHQHVTGMPRPGVAQETVLVGLAEDVIVRKMQLPPQYDDKGNVKKYTTAELKEFKGSNKKLPGYEGDVADIKTGTVIQVLLRAKKKKDDTKDSDKKDAATKPKKDDADQKDSGKKDPVKKEDEEKPDPTMKDAKTDDTTKDVKKTNPAVGAVAQVTGVVTKVGSTDRMITMKVEVQVLQAAQKGAKATKNKTVTLDQYEVSMAVVIYDPVIAQSK